MVRQAVQGHRGKKRIVKKFEQVYTNFRYLQYKIQGTKLVNTTQMSKGILEGCVLQILNNQKLFSQEIVMQIQSLGFIHVSDGTLFPLLLRLEQEGYFDIDLIPVSNGPKRKYYTLNLNGKEELSRFIEAWKSLEDNVNRTLKGGDDHV